MKPFEVIVKQLTEVLESYKQAKSLEDRRKHLVRMRLIIDEAESLRNIPPYERPDVK